MDRQEFGQLAAALRRQYVDPDMGRSWTQETLAERANLSPKMVANIEQGRKRTLAPALVASLARALQLTRGERREFLALAAEMDLDDAHELPPAQEPAEILDDLTGMLRSIPLPAYLCDPFLNVVAVNAAALALHCLPETQARCRTVPLREEERHLLLSALDGQSPARRALQSVWEEFLWVTVHRLRAMTLRYRHLPFCQELLSRLCQYAEFHEMWERSRYEDLPDSPAVGQVAYLHPLHGRLAYGPTMHATSTPAGRLYLFSVMPLDNSTVTTFQRLAGSDRQEVTHLAPWPHPALTAAHGG